MLDSVAEQKQAGDKRTAELQRQLKAAQVGSPCAGVRVPDAVTQRLRERAAEINAAATGSN
ncbi:hypothetical protein [Limnobaculum allomyrinae]|uniref:hypothetical protein n=1 Tax=Limnobaculum allomyrinae TaxID=2791986 RepID=UPI001E4A818E|nr:hypothetical protein [Limnobaculum allomyrinae]